MLREALTKTDEYSEKFQATFDPLPPHFRKIILQFFGDTLTFTHQIYPEYKRNFAILFLDCFRKFIRFGEGRLPSLLFPVTVTFCGILNHFLFQMSRWSDLQILNRLPFGRRFMHFIFYTSQIIFRLEVSGGLRPSRPSGHTWFWSPTPKPESQILTLPRSLSATISSWNCEI